MIVARFATVLLALVVPAHAQPQTWAWDDGTVPYVQTPMEIVERMMRMAEVGKDDYLIDLGSGDGRIVIEAAKRGARGLGVDLDPNLVKQATENAQRAGVAERARFEVKDIFETDLSGASVVAFYLLPDFNAKLLPKLLALPPGTRIVSHDGGIADWPADERLEMRAPEKPVGVKPWKSWAGATAVISARAAPDKSIRTADKRMVFLPCGADLELVRPINFAAPYRGPTHLPSGWNCEGSGVAAVKINDATT